MKTNFIDFEYTNLIARVFFLKSLNLTQIYTFYIFLDSGKNSGKKSGKKSGKNNAFFCPLFKIYL